MEFKDSRGSNIQMLYFRINRNIMEFKAATRRHFEEIICELIET